MLRGLALCGLALCGPVSSRISNFERALSLSHTTSSTSTHKPTHARTAIPSLARLFQRVGGLRRSFVYTDPHGALLSFFLSSSRISCPALTPFFLPESAQVRQIVKVGMGTSTPPRRKGRKGSWGREAHFDPHACLARWNSRNGVCGRSKDEHRGLESTRTQMEEEGCTCSYSHNPSRTPHIPHIRRKQGAQRRAD